MANRGEIREAFPAVDVSKLCVLTVLSSYPSKLNQLWQSEIESGLLDFAYVDIQDGELCYPLVLLCRIASKFPHKDNSEADLRFVLGP